MHLVPNISLYRLNNFFTTREKVDTFLFQIWFYCEMLREGAISWWVIFITDILHILSDLQAHKFSVNKKNYAWWFFVSSENGDNNRSLIPLLRKNIWYCEKFILTTIYDSFWVFQFTNCNYEKKLVKNITIIYVRISIIFRRKIISMSFILIIKTMII